MTIKKITPSSDCSTLSAVRDDDTIGTGVVSRVAVEGQQVNPSVTHTVRTRKGRLVVTEALVQLLNYDRTPTYISAQGPVDMPNRCKVYREGVSYAKPWTDRSTMDRRSTVVTPYAKIRANSLTNSPFSF